MLIHAYLKGCHNVISYIHQIRHIFPVSICGSHICYMNNIKKFDVSCQVLIQNSQVISFHNLIMARLTFTTYWVVSWRDTFCCDEAQTIMKSPLRQSSVAYNEEEVCWYQTSVPLLSATKISIHINNTLEGNKL